MREPAECHRCGVVTERESMTEHPRPLGMGDELLCRTCHNELHGVTCNGGDGAKP